MPSAGRGLRAKLALAAASVFAVLAAAELAMRVAGVGEVVTYRADPRFGYLMQPSQRASTYGTPVEINSLGLRGPEPLEPKPREVTRVLFLGDSITYGGGRIPEAELFCRRLEAQAAEHGLRVEALNVSAPGWSPQNWAAWVVANGTHSAELAVAVIPAIDLARPFASLDQHAMLGRAPLLRLASIWQRVTALSVQSVPLTPDAEAKNLAAIRGLAAYIAPIPLVAVFVPSRVPNSADDWAPYEALFPDALDLRGSLAPSDFFDDVHLALSGHRVVGERLYPYLAPRLAAPGSAAAAGAPLVLELETLPPPHE